ncbi:hypothetical protein G6L37_06820 [Agrobacterium rubi]|nr:hypothetical protein [Agrobacterium rubi]NTF25077.1 hypothetical protein [Agrobacterium rubi]
MFDVDGLKDGSIAKVEAAIARCRDGSFTGDRAARASAVLIDEAQAIAARHLCDAFRFDAGDFAAYVQAFPSLPEFHGSGDIEQAVVEGVHWHIMLELESEITDVLLEQYPSPSLAELLLKLEAGISGTLNLIPQFGGYRLERAMQACRDGADSATLWELHDELGSQADQMRSLIHRLDIADPPTADYAGRGRRLLLEARDLIALVEKTGSLSEFCTASAIEESAP